MEKEAQPPRLLPTAVALTVLFLASAFWGSVNEKLFCYAVALCGFALLTMGALISAVRGASPLAFSRAGRAGFYLLLGVGTVAISYFNNATAQKHAAQVIEACEAYKTRHGMYPLALQQLVPEFLPAVPGVTFMGRFGKFSYQALEKCHVLSYSLNAPYGRNYYHFEEARWLSGRAPPYPCP